MRHVAITSEHPLDLPVAGECGVRLRQRHFPRLLTMDDTEYPVCAPDVIGECSDRVADSI
jgi:hypothetical protein